MDQAEGFSDASRTTSINSIKKKTPDQYQVARRSAIRKFDFIVIPIVTTFFLLSFLDRVNIGNAKLAGLQTDLGLTNTQYSIALTVTYVPYIVVELPSNLLLKKLGPQIMLPTMLVLWGIVTTLQGLVTSYSGLLAARFFLGLCEGGLLPGIMLYLAGFYKRHQLQLRVAMLYSATSLAGAFSGLLASAISLMDGIGGKRGWAWIFILEGLFTVLFGAASFFVMPQQATTARFLTAEEKVAVEEMLKGEWTTDDHEPFSWAEVWAACKSPHVLIFIMTSFFNGTTVFGLAFFSPTIVAGLGYSSIRAQLMSVPPYACSFVVSLATAWLSDRYQQRGLALIFSGILATVGYGMYLGSADLHTGYGSLFLQNSGVFISAPTVSVWLANNVVGHYKRATALGLVFVVSNCGGILSTWIFTTPPRYHTATSINMAFSIGIIVTGAANMWYFSYQNKLKAAYVPTEKEGGANEQAEMKRLGDRHHKFIYTL